jgi:hypothetical protein
VLDGVKQFAILNTYKANNEINRRDKMNRMTEMHIEYLRGMMNHANEDWAAEAEKELNEIKVEFTAKGIFIV